MGEVFECYDPRLMRVVAVKRVLAARATSAKARARFWREARALAAIDHPGVVKVFEIGESADGGLFLAMQRVLGESLEQQLGDEAWPSAAAAELGARLADILAAVHAAGVVHRDLKPSNVILQPDGTPVLVDFGIAAGADPDAGPLTDVGQVVGTTSYMAPEQLEGRPDVGPAADVFAWGILVYRLLAGRHPFVRDSREQTAMALAAGTFPALKLADAPALGALVERCLAVLPARRPRDGGALVEALLAAGIGQPTAPRPPTRAATVIPMGPTEQPAALVVRGSRTRPRWPLLAALAALVGVLVFLVTRAAPGTVALAPITPAAVATRTLPPRPVVILTNSPGDDDKIAAQIVDILAADLGERPLDVRVAPESASHDADVRVVSAIRGDRLTLTVRDAADGRVRWSGAAALSGRPPIEVARELGRGLWGALGLAPPATLPPLTTTDDAYAQALAARASGRRGDVEETRAHLERAFRQDPRFVPARMEELALLRTERRLDELASAATTLLARTDLSQHDRAMASAWLALAKDDPQGAVRGMYDVIARWPYDLVAYESLLALLFSDTRVADLAEAERVARQALAFAPATPTIASRYIRALGWRGRGAETEATLGALGVPLATMPDLRAEIALYRGDFAEAVRGFDAWLVREPEHVYALNMGIAARILGGDCQRAAELAQERISRVENRGTDDNLSWSYSLAVQALACTRNWDAARQTLARWSKRHPGSADEARVHALWIDLASGTPEPDVALAARAAIDKDLSESKSAPLDACELLALIATGAEQLDPCRRASDARAFDLDVPAHDRARWGRLAKRIQARTAWLAGDHAGALLIIKGAVFPLSEVRHETDLMQRVEALFMLARAAQGDEAVAAWRQIDDAGYARVYLTPLWTMARTALGSSVPR